MDATTFSAELERLRRSLSAPAGNPGGFRLQDCENCPRCMFCVRCDACYRCSHCTDCSGCTECLHSTGSVGCHRSSHLAGCRNCHGSAYLVLCDDCSDCTYCLGCVGLSGKEFHILNQPYERKQYFEILRGLGPGLNLQPQALSVPGSLGPSFSQSGKR